MTRHIGQALRVGLAAGVLALAIGAGMAWVAPTDAVAVDLEPPRNFNAACSAAEKELIWAREDRYRARRRLERARESMETCRREKALGNRRHCRREKRELGEAASKHTRASADFQNAAILRRKECNREYDD